MKLPLYIHIPFCSAKCRYCAFYSCVYDRSAAQRLLEIYRRQLAEFQSRYKVEFSPVYIGGGTPSVLDNDLIESLLENFCGGDAEEFSFEANPESLTEDKLALLKEKGVNRISLGVQTFSDKCLKFLGRRHGRREAERALADVFRAGFANVSIDLIFAVPGQSQGDAREDLRLACRFPLKHISLYSLIYEEGTALGRLRRQAEIKAWEEEEEAGFYAYAVDYLARQGLRRYEVSNFARPGYACRHNINYWEDNSFFAVGPAAVYFYQGRRRRYVSSVSLYIKNWQQAEDIIAEDEVVQGERYAREKAAFGLRMSRGIDYAEFRRSTAYDFPSLFRAEIDKLKKESLLEETAGGIKVSPSAFFLADYISRQFVSSL